MQVAEEQHTLSGRAPNRISRIAWPALLLVIFIGFFWRLVLTKNQYTWLEGSDMAYQVLPWYQFQAAEWHHGRLPLWDSYLWGGQPLVGQMQPGAAYPLNWLMFLAPLQNGHINQTYLQWYFMLIHFQAGLFCYWLCRDLGRSPPASVLAGLAFGLGGFIGSNNWPQMLNGAVWAPLVLLFFFRAMRGERPISSAAWSGVFLGVAFLSGHHQIPIFLSLAMAGVWIYYLATDLKNLKLKLKLLFTFGVFLALTSAVQLLPAYEYGRLSLRWVGAPDPVGWKDRVPYYVHQQFPFGPEAIFGIVIPGMSRHSDAFVGLVAVTLALFGLASGWFHRTARLFGAIALGGLLFSLGPNSVFHGILYALLPVVEKARNPAMASFIFHIGLCVLIAYGIDGYHSLRDAIVSRTVSTVLVFSALIAIAILILTATKTPLEDRLGIVFLAGIVLAAILTAWRRGRISDQGAVTALALLMLLELGNVTTYAMPAQGQINSRLKELSEHADIAAFLKNQKEPVRVEVDDKVIQYNFGDWYGIDEFGGYLASLTENLSRVQGTTAGRMLYAVNFYLGKQPSRPDQVELFTGTSGVKVYRNPSALPRTWVVHEAITIQRSDQIAPMIESATFDAKRTTFLKGTAPQLEHWSEPEKVSLVRQEPGLVAIEVDLARRGMVIDAGTFYPGWVATVDGKPAPVHEAYGVLRGVVVEAGQHRIEMRYRPKSVYWGAAFTALGLLGAALLRARDSTRFFPPRRGPNV